MFKIKDDSEIQRQAALEFAAGNRIKAFEGIEHKAEMKLDQFESALSLLDLYLPGNHLEALKGETARDHQ